MAFLGRDEAAVGWEGGTRAGRGQTGEGLDFPVSHLRMFARP